jgi:citrate lyase subunit beta/citryl-CoA lyase
MFARAAVKDLLIGGERDWSFLVRINPFGTGLTLEDLAAVVRPGLDGILIPKVNGIEDVDLISHYVDVLEVAAGVAPGHVKLLIVATETPAAMIGFNGYARKSKRLVAMTWGAEDLGAALGALTNKEADGSWTFPYRVARAQCLFAAGAAGVAALDTLYADFRDQKGLAETCRIARRDGFVGRIAIHPDQVATINSCFTPAEADIEHARRVVAAFAAAPDVGTVGIDGKMYDIRKTTPRSAKVFALLSRASTTNIGWRVMKTASSPANFTAPWQMPVGSVSPCRSSMEVPVWALPKPPS